MNFLCKTKKVLKSLALTSLVVWISPFQTLAQGSFDPNIDTAVCTAAGDQNFPAIIADGVNGAIIVWQDHRNGNWDIFAQRLDAERMPQWTGNGVAICTEASNQGGKNGGGEGRPQLVSDGAGGAIIVWRDERGGNTADIFAQHIDANGNVQWQTNGVPICTASGEQSTPTLVSDGTGGAIITWEDFRNVIADIYAQRIDASGAVQWTADGVVISSAQDQQRTPKIVSDAAGGAIIAWADLRNGAVPQFDIYAQRVDPSGVGMWPNNGVAISRASDDQSFSGIISDDAGGAIITWHDGRSGGNSNSDIYAQRIDAQGNVQWSTNGVALNTSSGMQFNPILASDGAVVTWTDLRKGAADSDVFAQRIDASGTLRWLADGIPVSDTTGIQWIPAITTTSSGGVIITWQDGRSGTKTDVYAVRIDTSGTVAGPSDGVAISTAAGDKFTPAIASNGAGDAFIAWSDSRNGSDSDIYAQSLPETVVSVEESSSPPAAFTLYENYPNPFNPTTGIQYSVGREQYVSLKVYDVLGKEVTILVNEVQTPGLYEVTFDAHGLAGGVYFYKLVAGSNVDVKKLLLIK